MSQPEYGKTIIQDAESLSDWEGVEVRLDTDSSTGQVTQTVSEPVVSTQYTRPDHKTILSKAEQFAKNADYAVSGNEEAGSYTQYCCTDCGEPHETEDDAYQCCFYWACDGCGNQYRPWDYDGNSFTHRSEKAFIDAVMCCNDETLLECGDCEGVSLTNPCQWCGKIING